MTLGTKVRDSRNQSSILLFKISILPNRNTYYVVNYVNTRRTRFARLSQVRFAHVGGRNEQQRNYLKAGGADGLRPVKPLRGSSRR